MRIITFVSGQSNANRTFQNEVGVGVSDKSVCHTTYYGGTPMSDWVAGTDPGYTRGANYTGMITHAVGLKPDRVVLIFMQGENDTAGDGSLAALWTGKLDAMVGFLQADFDTTDVRVVIGKPWPQDSELPPNLGYETLREEMGLWVAENPSMRASFETSDIYRPPGNVHYTEWTALNVPGSTAVAVERALAAAAPFYL